MEDRDIHSNVFKIQKNSDSSLSSPGKFSRVCKTGIFSSPPPSPNLSHRPHLHTRSPLNRSPLLAIIHHHITPPHISFRPPNSRIGSTPHPPESRTPLTTPLHQSSILLFLLPPLLFPQQISNFLITRTPVPHLLAEDECFFASWVASFAHFALAVEVGACY